MSTHFDLAIIGTGSGNSIVDGRFEDRRVAMIEDGIFGGTCINVGCIPTKMFVFPADLARAAMAGPGLGVQTSFEGADWREIRDRIFGRVDGISVSGRELAAERTPTSPSSRGMPASSTRTRSTRAPARPSPPTRSWSPPAHGRRCRRSRA